MGKKDKKKGKGAEKTAAKTEKKALHRAKKELAAKGEDDIEKLIAEFQIEDKKQNLRGVEPCSPPTPRSGFTLCIYPEKDELLLFGGEYFNGNKTLMYNELYFYSIKKNNWSILHCPDKPPPRCSHQAVTLSQKGGQMWIFGGEFASPTRSNFYHYKDLWVLHLGEHRWEQVKVPGGPSSRSGHRMILNCKKLFVFGGFHETVRDYKYFDDVYIFDLEEYKWLKIEPVGKCPSPRSGCQLIPLVDGRILLYGGYCREKVKKDIDKGVSYTDMYYLQLDEKCSPAKWKWILIKQTGTRPSCRSGFSMVLGSGNKAFAFGGVYDEEDSEESLKSVFYNDLYSLELDNGRWLFITLRGKENKVERKPRRKKEHIASDESDDELEDASFQTNPSVCETEVYQPEVKTFEDDVFTVKIETQCSANAQEDSSSCSSANNPKRTQPFSPHPRMNTSLVIKHNILYLYGGLYEDGDKQITLSDFYSLDLHKLNEWKVLIPSNLENVEWYESADSDEDSEENSCESECLNQEVEAGDDIE